MNTSVPQRGLLLCNRPAVPSVQRHVQRRHSGDISTSHQHDQSISTLKLPVQELQPSQQHQPRKHSIPWRTHHSSWRTHDTRPRPSSNSGRPAEKNGTQPSQPAGQRPKPRHTSAPLLLMNIRYESSASRTYQSCSVQAEPLPAYTESRALTPA